MMQQQNITLNICFSQHEPISKARIDCCRPAQSTIKPNAFARDICRGVRSRFQDAEF